MNGSRFDAWTRRRLSLAAGGLVASLAGLALPEDGDAKNTHKNKNKRRKKRCRKVGQICQESGKHRCCQGNVREDFDGQNFRCCKDLGQPCSEGGACCASFCIEGRCMAT